MLTDECGSTFCLSAPRHHRKVCDGHHQIGCSSEWYLWVKSCCMSCILPLCTPHTSSVGECSINSDMKQYHEIVNLLKK